MRANLLERRLKMLKLNSMALPLVDVVKTLSDEYDVTKQALYHDWKKRGEWQTEIFDLDDLKQLCLDIYANHREIYRMASREYLTGDNSSARVGALNLLRKLNLDFLEMFPKALARHTMPESKRGADLNDLLKEYDRLFTESEKPTMDVKLSWQTVPNLTPEDMAQFTEEQRETIRGGTRLIRKALDEKREARYAYQSQRRES